jgi:hypothetical protein
MVVTKVNHSNTAVDTTLTAGITSGDTSIAVAATTGWPSAPFYAVLTPGDPSTEEVILVTSVVSLTWTATRASDGTTAKAHANGADVIHAVVATDLEGGILGGREVATTAPSSGDAMGWNGSLWTPTAIAYSRGRPKVGGTSYYAVPGATFSSVGTRNMTNGRIYYSPWTVDRVITIDQLAIEVSTNVASSECRIGVYNADTDWQPTSLIVDSGIIDCSTTGVKTVSVSITLQPGRYLAAVIANSTQTLRQFRGGNAFLTDTLGATPFYQDLFVASTYGPLNSTGVAWTSSVASAGGIGHQIVARISTP